MKILKIKMAKNNNTSSSETVTENIFRDFYGSSTFIEKSAIPTSLAFNRKSNQLTKVILTFY
jgi:type I restriction enzyme M protein